MEKKKQFLGSELKCIRIINTLKRMAVEFQVQSKNQDHLDC